MGVLGFLHFSWVQRISGVELLVLFNSIPPTSLLGVWFWQEKAELEMKVHLSCSGQCEVLGSGLRCHSAQHWRGAAGGCPALALESPKHCRPTLGSPTTRLLTAALHRERGTTPGEQQWSPKTPAGAETAAPTLPNSAKHSGPEKRVGSTAQMI